jgi:hypothetical protein
VIYDTEEEAVSKLVVEEVKDEMWSDISGKLPSNHKLRKKALQCKCEPCCRC